MEQYWKILKKYKWNLMLSPLFVGGGVVCETFQPMLMARIVDHGVMERDLGVISSTGVLMIGMAFVMLALSIMNALVSARTSTRFGTGLRQTLFHKVQQFSFPEMDRFGSASLVTRLTSDVTRIQQIVFMSMRIMLRAPMMFVASLFFILSIDRGLALILVAVIPLMALSVWLVLRRGLPFFLKVQQRVDRLNAVVRENLINIRVVKSFVREDFETRKFERSSGELRDTAIRASNIIISLFPAIQLIMNVSVVAVLWFGGAKTMDGRLTVGELISFVNYLMLTLMSLVMFSMVVMNFARASASSQRILEVLGTKPSLTDTPEALRHHYTVERGEVEFRNVSFRYAGSANDVLTNVSFDVRPGETVAVIGATGSAKSSMVQLIPRLYDVTGGEVLIDGRDVRDYRLDELRRGVAMVLQRNELFTGTIKENLYWGDAEAADEAIREAAEAAEAHDFIASFGGGYETVLGRGGVNVSGGQKQRISLARTLLRKPKILILDDSTSAVDSATELRIRANLRERLRGTTVFIITQRVATMQAADRILVLNEGRVEAFGTPAELLRTSPLYREIYESQQPDR